MSADQPYAHLPLDERERLEVCAREPIRAPGSIQPHGALLGIDPRDQTVTLASENAADMLGLEHSPLGRPLLELFGASFAAEIRAAMDDNVGASPIPLAAPAGEFDAIVHEAREGLVVIELEPEVTDRLRRSTPLLYDLVHRLSRTRDRDELFTLAADGLRSLTDFDRVLVYHFHPDGHGEVVAEACADDMDPYCGHHFPASDIPEQARQLYLTKLSRAIVGTSGARVPLVALDGAFDAANLDLGGAELRSVSPHHLEYMRNMGQSATVSFSLVHDGELIGMITCAHRSLRRISFLMRQGIEVLANQLALQLSAFDQLERLRREVALRKTRADLVAQISATDEIAFSLVRGAVSALDLIEADGLAVRIGGRTRVVGHTPPTTELEAIAGHVIALGDTQPFFSEAFARDYPDVAGRSPSVIGVLVVPIGGTGDYIAFFRDEVLKKVNWLGDQTDANRDTPLSPRRSFASWTQSVTGTAPAWGELAGDALDLARDIEGALLRRVESDLAQLAMHDQLTGLPNRRPLIDRLDALVHDQSVGDVSLLFIDLDGFKEINDTYGHDVGDAVITAVAQSILAATRAEDLVARLGGDEFVILCPGLSARDAVAAAGRVQAAVAAPLLIDGTTIVVTASIGCASLDASALGTGATDVAADLLRRADEAMYRAKDSHSTASAGHGQV